MDKNIIYTTYNWKIDPFDFSLEKLNGITVGDNENKVSNCFMIMNVNTWNNSYIGSSYGLFWVNNESKAHLINNNTIWERKKVNERITYEIITDNSVKQQIYDLENKITNICDRIDNIYDSLSDNVINLQTDLNDLNQNWKNSYNYVLAELDKINDVLDIPDEFDDSSDI